MQYYRDRLPYLLWRAFRRDSTPVRLLHPEKESLELFVRGGGRISVRLDLPTGGFTEQCSLVLGWRGRERLPPLRVGVRPENPGVPVLFSGPRAPEFLFTWNDSKGSEHVRRLTELTTSIEAETVERVASFTIGVRYITAERLRDVIGICAEILLILENIGARPPPSERPRESGSGRETQRPRRGPTAGFAGRRVASPAGPVAPTSAMSPPPIVRFGLADRGHLERWIDELYTLRGLRPPLLKIWCGNPLSGALVASAISKNRKPMDDFLHSPMLSDVFISLNAPDPNSAAHLADLVRNLGAGGRAEEIGRLIERTVHGQLSVPLSHEDLLRARRTLARHFPTRRFDPEEWEDREGLQRTFTGAVPGVLDFSHLSGVVGAWSHWQPSPLLESMMEVTKSCGWWWPTEDSVVLVPPPSRVVLGEDGMPHRTDGPAIEFADGWGIWCWKGVPVSPEVVLAPESLTCERILDEPDLRVRRVMVERMGVERLSASGAVETIEGDDAQALLRLPMPEDEPVTMVRVTCPSTGHVHHLRVPPWIGTLRQAVAWTFGLPAAGYHPERET